MDNELFERVLMQIKEDIICNDLMAIHELLSMIPEDKLTGYLETN
jgi:hypothetical protein